MSKKKWRIIREIQYKTGASAYLVDGPHRQKREAAFLRNQRRSGNQSAAASRGTRKRGSSRDQKFRRSVAIGSVAMQREETTLHKKQGDDFSWQAITPAAA